MTDKKNILLVISKFPPEYSGPGVRIPRFYEWYQTKNDSIHLDIICNGKEQTKSETYSYQGWRVRRIVPGWLLTFFSIFPFLPDKLTNYFTYQIEFIQTWLYFLFSSALEKCDLMHVIGHSGGTAAALVWARIKNIPVLLELVTARAPYKQPYLLFFRTALPKQVKVIALTKNMKNRCLKEGLEGEKIWCRPNSIDETKFCLIPNSEKMDMRAELTPFTSEQIVLVSVAKMMPQKNQRLILDILPYLPEHFVALIGGPIIKDGPLYERDLVYTQELRSVILNLQLESRVQLVTDFVSAPSFMKAGDIYLMPAWNEGLGTPMLEAMGCGLPVVANKDEPAFQEWICDGKNGFLCDIDDPKAWAKAIEKLSSFTDDERFEISKEIHFSAGQKPIYAHYEKIIDELMV